MLEVTRASSAISCRRLTPRACTGSRRGRWRPMSTPPLARAGGFNQEAVTAQFGRGREDFVLCARVTEMTRPYSIDRGKLKLSRWHGRRRRPLLEKYGANYFHEAGFDAFSAFDLERAAREMARQISLGDTPFILAELDGEVVGMVSWTMSHVFTARPIAHLWMIYVMPPHRQSAVGRLLVWFAADIAKSEGACAFLRHRRRRPRPRRGSLCNLFRRCGFAPMGGAFTRRSKWPASTPPTAPLSNSRRSRPPRPRRKKRSGKPV